MFSFSVNYLAVLVSGVVGMAIGALWYGPLFGKKWMALSKKTEADIEEAKKKGMVKCYVVAFIAVLVMAFVLANVVAMSGAGTLWEGVQVGFWMWLGFVGVVLLNSVLWDNKPCELWVLNNAHYLIAIVVMSVILTLWR